MHDDGWGSVWVLGRGGEGPYLDIYGCSGFFGERGGCGAGKLAGLLGAYTGTNCTALCRTLPVDVPLGILACSSSKPLLFCRLEQTERNTKRRKK